MTKQSASKISSFTQHEIAHLRTAAQHIYAAQGLRILAAFSFSPPSRILIIIPRTSGNAVKRNLIRRRIKSIFHQANFASHGRDYVIIVKKSAIELSYQTLEKHMLKAAQVANEQMVQP